MVFEDDDSSWPHAAVLAPPPAQASEATPDLLRFVFLRFRFFFIEIGRHEAAAEAAAFRAWAWDLFPGSVVAVSSAAPRRR